MVNKSNYRKNRKSNKLIGGSNKWNRSNLIVPTGNHQGLPDDFTGPVIETEINLENGQLVYNTKSCIRINLIN